MSAVRSKVLRVRRVYNAGKATFVGEYEIMDSDVDYILLKRLKINFITMIQSTTF